jgi:hypothetical protein
MRGRAMIRPLARGWLASLALSFSGPAAHVPFAGTAGEWLMRAVITGFAVFAAWNIAHPDVGEREERLEEEREQRRLIAEHAGPRARGAQWAEAVLAAQRAGTFSLNGVQQPGTTLRYPGPPAVYTPADGFEMMIHVELKAAPQVSASRTRISRQHRVRRC